MLKNIVDLPDSKFSLGLWSNIWLYWPGIIDTQSVTAVYSLFSMASMPPYFYVLPCPSWIYVPFMWCCQSTLVHMPLLGHPCWLIESITLTLVYATPFVAECCSTSQYPWNKCIEHWANLKLTEVQHFSTAVAFANISPRHRKLYRWCLASWNFLTSSIIVMASYYHPYWSHGRPWLAIPTQVVLKYNKTKQLKVL